MLPVVFACSSQTSKDKKGNGELAPKTISQYAIYKPKCTNYYPQDSMLESLMDRSQIIIHGKIIESFGGSIDASWINIYLAIKAIDIIKGELPKDTIVINYPQPFDDVKSKRKMATDSAVSVLLKQSQFNHTEAITKNSLLQDGSELILFLKRDTNCITEYKYHKFFCLFPTDIWFSVLPYSERLIVVMKSLLKNIK
jgi:hypothetical protein